MSGKAAKEPTELPVWPEAETLPCLWAAILLVNGYESMGSRAIRKGSYKTSGLYHLSQGSSAFLEPAEAGQVSLVHLTPPPFKDCPAAAGSNADLDPASDLVMQVRSGDPEERLSLLPWLSSPHPLRKGTLRVAVWQWGRRGQSSSANCNQGWWAGHSSWVQHRPPPDGRAVPSGIAGVRSAMQTAGPSGTAGLKGSAVHLVCQSESKEVNRKSGLPL